MLKIGNLYQLKKKRIVGENDSIVMFDLPSFKYLNPIYNKDIFICLGYKKLRKYASAMKILKKDKIGFIYEEELKDFFIVIDLEKNNETFH